MPAGGSLAAARALVGKWLRKPHDGCSKVAQFGRVEGLTGQQYCAGAVGCCLHQSLVH
jgi:hypothetical protein